MATARFIYDTAIKSPDVFYATNFFSFDPVAFFEHRGKKYLVVDDLEFDRAKKQASVDKVILASEYRKDLEIRKGYVVEIMSIIFKKMKIDTLEVPGDFSLSLANGFKSKKFKIKIGPRPFFEKRTIKTAEEKKLMILAQKNTFRLIGLVEKALIDSTIRNNKIYYKGKPLTSEFLKKEITLEAVRLGLRFDEEPIVACGEHAIDPHDRGRGELRPHQAIVVDIFPQLCDSRFCGDATRTFCKGTASPELKKQYNIVKLAQETAIKKIRAGVNGKDIHTMVVKLFESEGYKTGQIDGRQQGFFHGTGHGIGLELHEYPPNINARDCTLKVGHVTSVEPGLYYKKTGGVRIEDLVYVTKTGCEVLSHYPKQLEIS